MFGIGFWIIFAILRWSFKKPRRIIFFPRIISRFVIANVRRSRLSKHIEGQIPGVLAISPTMNCNYNCIGCYSRDRLTDEELSTEELDKLFTEAEHLGISSVVVTGGEPFLRRDLIGLMEKHKTLLFVVITNGSFFSPMLVRRIADSGNIIVLISIEGFEEDTDKRRKDGAYNTAVKAMRLMSTKDVLYGFAATNTCRNFGTLSSDEFIDKMISLGCTLGFFTEYVPCGNNPRYDWLMSQSQREELRRTVIKLRKTKPIVIIQFPHDEYGKDNICSAAGKASFHINSKGDVEPCPFSPYSCDNVRNGGLELACKSKFLKTIREHQELLRRKDYACALFEHREEIEKLCENLKGKKKMINYKGLSIAYDAEH
ncbi:MAG: radical SAM/SPASM domain-containing protein [bacterium]